MITVGIDLGTTFCCAAYVNAEGHPEVIKTSDYSETLPSVIWFDGKRAIVGNKAVQKKISINAPIYEYIKREMGKEVERFKINGFNYGPTGLSAIILRKIKKDIFSYFRNKKIIQSGDEKSFLIPAVITVPAYFGDLQRQETKKAGIAAGFDVLSIINEPTAAALAYGFVQKECKTIMVFDLGGGTFDVTILEIEDTDGTVKASDGADELGGKDWDELIIQYVYDEFHNRTNKFISEDRGFDIQQEAIDAKIRLSTEEMTHIRISDSGEDVEICLYREEPENSEMYAFDVGNANDQNFYFEERSSSLLQKIRVICTRLLERAGMTWVDIDEIVMTGGSCRMPMIKKLLENMSGKKVASARNGFNYDTSISVGAALSAANISKIQDVATKTIGIKVTKDGVEYIEHMIHQNTPLPVKLEQNFHAEQNAVLKLYEGESRRPDECILRGKLELENPEGEVTVQLSIDNNGVLSSRVEYFPEKIKELRIKAERFEMEAEELKKQIFSLDIN